MEGANGLGRLLAQQLVAAGEDVVDVPAKLATRVRVLNTGHGRKTDHADAASVATAALLRKTLGQELLADLRRLDKALASNRRRCAAAVEASGRR